MPSPDSFDIEAFLPYLLNQAADASSLGFQRYYKAKYGMLRTEWRVLFHVGRASEITAKEIVEVARIHKTKVSRAVAALEKKRFVAREEVAQDRRHAVIRLTKSGEGAYRDLKRAAAEFDAKLVAHIPEADRAAFLRSLKALAALADPR